MQAPFQVLLRQLWVGPYRELAESKMRRDLARASAERRGVGVQLVLHTHSSVFSQGSQLCRLVGPSPALLPPLQNLPRDASHQASLNSSLSSLPQWHLQAALGQQLPAALSSDPSSREPGIARAPLGACSSSAPGPSLSAGQDPKPSFHTFYLVS